MHCVTDTGCVSTHPTHTRPWKQFGTSRSRVAVSGPPAIPTRESKMAGNELFRTSAVPLGPAISGATRTPTSHNNRTAFAALRSTLHNRPMESALVFWNRKSATRVRDTWDCGHELRVPQSWRFWTHPTLFGPHDFRTGTLASSEADHCRYGVNRPGSYRKTFGLRIGVSANCGPQIFEARSPRYGETAHGIGPFQTGGGCSTTFLACTGTDVHWIAPTVRQPSGEGAYGCRREPWRRGKNGG